MFSLSFDSRPGQANQTKPDRLSKNKENMLSFLIYSFFSFQFSIYIPRSRNWKLSRTCYISLFVWFPILNFQFPVRGTGIENWKPKIEENLISVLIDSFFNFQFSVRELEIENWNVNAVFPYVFDFQFLIFNF